MDITDARLVRVILKIRTSMAELTRQYEVEYGRLKEQKSRLDAEMLKRLLDRGADSTKTDEGTAYVAEEMSASCSDENTFYEFVRATGDLDFFERRIKIGHLREYMEEHNGRIPPGLNVFRQNVVRVRAPTSKKEKSE
jgi:hypothetical protein